VAAGGAAETRKVPPYSHTPICMTPVEGLLRKPGWTAEPFESLVSEMIDWTVPELGLAATFIHQEMDWAASAAGIMVDTLVEAETYPLEPSKASAFWNPGVAVTVGPVVQVAPVANAPSSPLPDESAVVAPEPSSNFHQPTSPLGVGDGTVVAVAVGTEVLVDVLVAVLVDVLVAVLVDVLVAVLVDVLVAVLVDVLVAVLVGVIVRVVVGSGVKVLVGTGVFVLVGTDVFVLVGTGVFVLVGTGVFVLVGTGVLVAVLVDVLVAVPVDVLVGVLVAVLVAVGTGVLVEVLVGVLVDVLVAVLVGVGVGVGGAARVTDELGALTTPQALTVDIWYVTLAIVDGAVIRAVPVMLAVGPVIGTVSVMVMPDAAVPVIRYEDEMGGVAPGAV